MEEIIKKELIELYNSFDKSNSLYERGFILSIFDYLNKIMPNDEDIDDMFQNLYSRLITHNDLYTNYSMLREKSINEFMNKNKLFFNNMERLSQPKKQFNGKFLVLPMENISYIIETFLQSIDINLLNFYHKMINEKRLIYSIDNAVMYTSISSTNIVILLEKLENLKDIMVFMHELGHAYYFSVNNVYISEREKIEVEIKDEIPAEVLETKFIRFIKDNGVYEYGLMLEELFDTIAYECDKKRDDFNNLKYLIAAYIATNVRDRDFDITKFFKHIYKSDIFYLINSLNNKKRIGKVLRK